MFRPFFLSLALFATLAVPTTPAHGDCALVFVVPLVLAPAWARGMDVPWSRYARARSFARRAHKGQQYGVSTEPFSYHLGRVDEVLARFGYGLMRSFDVRVRVAGQLHDIGEDSPAFLAELQLRFGSKMAATVELLTFPTGMDRKEALQRFALAVPSDPVAVIAKLADRIANVEEALFDLFEDHDASFFERYRAEWPLLSRALLLAGPAHVRARRMLAHLDDIFSNRAYAQSVYLRQLSRHDLKARLYGTGMLRRSDPRWFPLPDLKVTAAERLKAIDEAVRAKVWEPLLEKVKFDTPRRPGLER